MLSFQLLQKKEHPARIVHVPHSEARSAQINQKSKQLSSNTGSHIRSVREERKPASMNGNMQRKTGPHVIVSAGKSYLTPDTSRKQLGSNNGNGPGRPVVAKGLPSKMPVTSMKKKISEPTAKHYPPHAKNSLPSVNKSLPSKNSAIPKKPLQQKKEVHRPSRGKLIPKQHLASSKPQMNEPVKQISSHSSLQEHRRKKKPVRRYSDDDAEALSMIRQMFR